jgi:polysaccharide deacetylase 2 family uncharacterized protein YibQ
MPKRRASSQPGRTPLILGALAALALIVFLGGELFAFLNSDTGRLRLYRHLHLGERAQITRIVGKHLHSALAAARVPSGALTEEPGAAQAAQVRWRVELPRDGAPMQVNYAITRELAEAGAEVISGHEQVGEAGALTVRLVAGLPNLPTHEVLISRPGRPHDDQAKRDARIALVFEGLGDDAEATRMALEIAAPTAVIAPAIGDGHEALLRQARSQHHEIVLAIPMEPENYPHVNPGPGTLLVSMHRDKIVNEARRFIRSGGDLVAVSNLYGSFATQDEPFITALYSVLKDASLPFLHLHPVARSVCKPLASQLGVAYDEPEFALDAEARLKKSDAIEKAWKQVLAYAGRRGHAIVVVRVTPMSAKWLQGAVTEKGLEGAQLVPLSSLIHHPSEH